MKRLALILLLIFSASLTCLGQDTMHRKEQEKEIMRYFIRNGDTVYISDIPPLYKRQQAPKGWKEKRKWRKYYRLVHNFAKAYPYALVAKEKLHEADRYIAMKNLSSAERERYIKNFEKDLFKTFEAPLRKLTITQGQILLRLIDREVGENSYEIIKMYRGGIAAGFWQGIAKLFGSNLKKPYDKDGEDKELEKLVKIYQDGEFNSLYYSIFGKMPPEPVIKPLNNYPQSLDF